MSHRFYYSFFGMKASEPVGARERVARGLDRVRGFLYAPTTAGWALAALVTVLAVLLLKAATTPRAARAADFLYLTFLNLLGGDR